MPSSAESMGQIILSLLPHRTRSGSLGSMYPSLNTSDQSFLEEVSSVNTQMVKAILAKKKENKMDIYRKSCLELMKFKKHKNSL